MDGKSDVADSPTDHLSQSEIYRIEQDARRASEKAERDQSRRENYFYGTDFEVSKSNLHKGALLTGAGLLAGFASLRYRVAGPSQMIVRTGLGISDISVTKKAVQFPFQTASVMSLEPITFPVEVDAMSQERIPFKMPTVWTVAPRTDTGGLVNYARLLSDKGPRGMKETIDGIIQGEARILTAKMPLDDLFQDREQFKESVSSNINEVITPLGLRILNANIAELADIDENNPYFERQKQRALAQVDEKARVHVAEAAREGETGEKDQRAQTRIQVALFEKDAKLKENERDRDIAESNKDLSVAQAEFTRAQEVARFESEAASQKRQAELQQEVEKARRTQEEQRRRAEDFSAANVGAEVRVRAAEGEAEAIKIKATADLFSKQQEAAGVLAMREAEAEGLRQLTQSAGGVDGLNKYLMVQGNMLPQLAEKQAEALRGLNPTVSVWQTGPAGAEGSGSGLSGVVSDLLKTGMPLLDGIKKQTGYDIMGALNVPYQPPRPLDKNTPEKAAYDQEKEHAMYPGERVSPEIIHQLYMNKKY